MVSLNPTTDLASDILRLKEERNAVILAHNYQTPEIFHCVADITGDSLALARKAVETDADVIVLAGVHFMAETAKLLNPDKTVLIPDLDAGCSLAESITAADLVHDFDATPVRDDRRELAAAQTRKGGALDAIGGDRSSDVCCS